MATPNRVAQAWIAGLSLLIVVLAGVGTIASIFTASESHHRTFTALRGELISIQGGGLYAHDSVSGTAQAIGQDYVTLLIGIPLLLVATWLALRGSLRGRLLQAGALWYFGYTYLLMALGVTYNPLFLVYVALYSASVFAFILALLSIDARQLPGQFSARFARRTIAWSFIGFGVLLTLLWLGCIVPSIASNGPPVGLEGYSTLFVQAGDLGLVIPLTIMTGVFLLRRHPIGYLLMSVVLVQGATFGLALVAMIIEMVASGVELALVEVLFFAAVAILAIAGVLHVLASLPTLSQM